MKQFTLVCTVTIASLFTMISCSTTKLKQHTIGCFERSKSDVIRSATALLVQHGLTVTMADTLIGLVQAESAESSDAWTGLISKRVWQVTVAPTIGGKNTSSATLSKPTSSASLYIIATAKTVNRTQNAYGATLATSEVYYDDSSHEDWEWYWGVRRGLESICGTKAVITTKPLH